MPPATSPNGRRAVTAASGRREDDEAGLPAPPGSAVGAGGGDSWWSRGAVSPPPFVPPRRRTLQVTVRGRQPVRVEARGFPHPGLENAVESCLVRLQEIVEGDVPVRGGEFSHVSAPDHNVLTLFRPCARRPVWREPDFPDSRAPPGTGDTLPVPRFRGHMLSRAPARGNGGNHAGTPLPVIPRASGNPHVTHDPFRHFARHFTDKGCLIRRPDENVQVFVHLPDVLGWMTVVVSGCVTMAGPRTTLPERSRARS